MLELITELSAVENKDLEVVTLNSHSAIYEQIDSCQVMVPMFFTNDVLVLHTDYYKESK